MKQDVQPHLQNLSIDDFVPVSNTLGPHPSTANKEEAFRPWATGHRGSAGTAKRTSDSTFRTFRPQRKFQDLPRQRVRDIEMLTALTADCVL